MEYVQNNLMEIVAILISLLSAIYARWSWNETKKANYISIHPNKMEIYDAYNDLVSYMKTAGIEVDIREVAKFYRYLEKSEFFFDNEIVNKLKAYFEICFELARLSRYCPPDKLEKVSERQDNLENEIIVMLKKVLKVL